MIISRSGVVVLEVREKLIAKREKSWMSEIIILSKNELMKEEKRREKKPRNFSFSIFFSPENRDCVSIVFISCHLLLDFDNSLGWSRVPTLITPTTGEREIKNWEKKTVTGKRTKNGKIN